MLLRWPERLIGRFLLQTHARLCGRRLRGRCDGAFRSAYNGVDAIKAAEGVAARTPLSFIASRRIVVKIITPCPLHQISADRRHIPDLPGGAEKDRLR